LTDRSDGSSKGPPTQWRLARHGGIKEWEVAISPDNVDGRDAKRAIRFFNTRVCRVRSAWPKWSPTGNGKVCQGSHSPRLPNQTRRISRATLRFTMPACTRTKRRLNVSCKRRLNVSCGRAMRCQISRQVLRHLQHAAA